MMITKKKAIQILQDQIKKIEELKDGSEYSPEYKKWHQKILVYIENIEKDNSRKFSVRFEAPSPKFGDRIHNEHFPPETFILGLDNTKIVLNGMIDEINEFWSKDNVSSKDNGGNNENDDLLPLLRRRVFDSHLVDRISEADRSGLPLSLVMIDLDHFKAVNDKHGHPIGDEVLICVSKIIMNSTGTKGTCYRYGGEEMCVLLPNFSVEEAATLAERIRREIEVTTMSSKELKITSSFGIAGAPTHAGTGEDLLATADQALYEAKDLGRNYVRISGEPRPSVPSPRKIERKQPEPDGLTGSQKEQIRIDYFRNGSAECPLDGGILEIIKLHDEGKKTPDLFVSCPLCGLSVIVMGPS